MDPSDSEGTGEWFGIIGTVARHPVLPFQDSVNALSYRIAYIVGAEEETVRDTAAPESFSTHKSTCDDDLYWLVLSW